MPASVSSSVNFRLPPGTIAVTGSPRRSTWLMRSRRGQRDGFLGSVDTMISSKLPSLTAASTATRGSGPPTQLSTERLAAKDQGEGDIPCPAVQNGSWRSKATL